MVEGEFGHRRCPLLGIVDGKKFGARSKRASFSYWADDHQPLHKETFPAARASSHANKDGARPISRAELGLALEYDDHCKGRQ
jgi:hypothetical protein